MLIYGAMMKHSNRKKQSLHQQVVDELGTQIIDGTFGAGDRLPNADELSGNLGVSRTVTREALRVLEEKGLVQSRPKFGIRVQPQESWKLLDSDVLAWHYQSGPSQQFVNALMQVRYIIEPAAAELAARHATDAQVNSIQAAYDRLANSLDDLEAYKQADRDFHAAIFDASGNPLLAHIASTINVDLDAGREITGTIPHSLAETLPVHEHLMLAIAEHNAPEAHQAAADLVDQVSGFIREALSKEA